MITPLEHKRNYLLMINRVVVCRAAGIQGWVAECHHADGRILLDLDVQARDLFDCINLAEEEYPDTKVTIECDPFWIGNYDKDLLVEYIDTKETNERVL
jgi:hypothetical protein